MKKIYVCSPLSGDIENNIKKARNYCRKIMHEGNMPLAPHIYFTQFLNDEKQEERIIGMNMGLIRLKECDEIWVFCQNGISSGMKAEIEYAEKIKIPIRYIGGVKN